MNEKTLKIQGACAPLPRRLQPAERKLVYLDYGFDLDRLRGRQRVAGEPFMFGYIGTHIPAKGIHS